MIYSKLLWKNPTKRIKLLFYTAKMQFSSILHGVAYGEMAPFAAVSRRFGVVALSAVAHTHAPLLWQSKGFILAD